MADARIRIYAGHYGSGKTNLAVNRAFALRRAGFPVTLCDMDIVNPYFRTKDSAGLLKEAGIRLISPEYANTNVDLPVIPAEAAAIFESTCAVVVDLGGDDAGAVAVGQFAHLFAKEPYEMLLVVNRCRLLTRSPHEAALVRREIEAASHLFFTGIVNNSNLGLETTVRLVKDSLPYAKEVAALTGLPVSYTAVAEHLYADAVKEMEGENIVPIRLYRKNAWEI